MNDKPIENSLVVFEANDYFEIIKSKQIKITENDLTDTLAIFADEYNTAKMINQTKLVNRLRFYIESTLKQVSLIDTPYTKYVESSLISDYIGAVNPKNSVKIVELERYCRIIPKKNAEMIHAAIKLNIFDDILVLYTDLTNQRNETKEEKAVIERNRDPIAFGVFRNKGLEVSNPKFYVITDWVDEWCDLTFEKLISECVKYNIEENHGVLKQNSMLEVQKKCREIIEDVQL